MDTVIWIFSLCVLLGSIVGFAAGLLGIGGGLIIVPALLYLLPSAGIDSAHLPHVAIATSLAAIILTSFSSAKAHQKRDNIDWHILARLAPGSLGGALLSGFVAKLIPAQMLQQAFAVFVILMALQMTFPFKPTQGSGLPGNGVIFLVTLLVAIVAGLMGIGGGALLVPLLSFWGLAMRYSVGISSAMGLLIAMGGTLGYVVSGLHASDMPAGTLGYIYLPALAGIVTSSVLVAPLGVAAASNWPTSVLKKIFAILLVVIGIKLIFS
ncbi:MAG: sulfite exporter TauE/SafE family protein [Shewanella sp.]|nr:sulfite exporter TauE/SafE family protein [Shewanella sp.]MCF1431014.1 sulfite exporter TauE/SafE family protein [Shewanella sp.]MCF1439558.1 sulfite exporter TauE/SafE family protein [Shewanella sp.]MCF1456492.1 sulfite exporter TauE/SafE family protein [Shewanella sp.]